MMSPVISAILAALVMLAQAIVFARPPMGRQPDAPTAVAIVVHPSNGVVNLTFRELRRIFMLETQAWPGGRRITVVLREKGQRERAEALRLICGMSELEYERHVLFQTFRGTVDRAPRSIRSADTMLRFVFNAPGAIGYVDAAELDGSTKVLRIDGSLPGDAGYPLQWRVPRPNPR